MTRLLPALTLLALVACGTHSASTTHRELYCTDPSGTVCRQMQAHNPSYEVIYDPKVRAA